MTTTFDQLFQGALESIQKGMPAPAIPQPVRPAPVPEPQGLGAALSPEVLQAIGTSLVTPTGAGQSGLTSIVRGFGAGQALLRHEHGQAQKRALEEAKIGALQRADSLRARAQAHAAELGAASRLAASKLQAQAAESTAKTNAQARAQTALRDLYKTALAQSNRDLKVLQTTKDNLALSTDPKAAETTQSLNAEIAKLGAYQKVLLATAANAKLRTALKAAGIDPIAVAPTSVSDDGNTVTYQTSPTTAIVVDLLHGTVQPTTVQPAAAPAPAPTKPNAATNLTFSPRDLPTFGAM